VEAGDIELIEAMRHGDEAALARLLERHAPGVYRFGLKMCRDPEDAEDIVQDTLLAAARGLKDFRGASSVSTWLYAIARSFCIKKRRHAHGADVSLDAPEALAVSSQAPAPEQVTANRELGAALEDAIAALEPIYREVLLLRDVEGLSAAQVAEILEIGVDAVKSRLHRARAVVRAKLEPFFPGEDRAASPKTAQCPDIVALFSRFLEGEIGADECARMDAHVKGCARCASGCASLKHTLALCRAEPRGAVPPAVQARVQQALRDLVTAQTPA